MYYQFNKKGFVNYICPSQPEFQNRNGLVF